MSTQLRSREALARPPAPVPVLSFISSSLGLGRITGLADIMVGAPEGAAGVKREFCVSIRPGRPPLRWHQACIVVSPSCQRRARSAGPARLGALEYSARIPGSFARAPARLLRAGPH